MVFKLLLVIVCFQCNILVFEYCSLHGPALVIPDTEVKAQPKSVPRSALTIPYEFLHLAPSDIPGGGIGVFSTVTIPRGVRFGPYRGVRVHDVRSVYCWRIKATAPYIIDGCDEASSNWLRYVNCARNCREQNLLAHQYRGEVYYSSIKIIPKHTELLVFYGCEFALELDIDLRIYNSDRITSDTDTTKTDINKYKTITENENICTKSNDCKIINIPDITKTVLCTICNKSYNRRSYSRHKKIHLAHKRHECPHCDFKSNSAYNLKNHINCKHTKDITYPCKLCTNVYYMKKSLKHHLKIHMKSI